MEKTPPYYFDSLSKLHEALGLPKPLHPLISLNDYKNISNDVSHLGRGMMTALYKVSYKKSYSGRVKYGQTYYDFDEGGMCFVSPNQVIYTNEASSDIDGFSLMFHPDFIRNYPLAKSIRNFGFFSYSANEALHLSEKEHAAIMNLFGSIRQELELPIDRYSQNVLVSQIEVLLNLSDRFYNRQFITRKPVHNDLLARLDEILNDYFDSGKAMDEGLPAVQHISDQLNVSPGYLSDMLRSLTGQSTLHHIHNTLIARAKDLLSMRTRSVSEIAYQLGFEHPQSFSKLFKQKTNQTPVEFVQSLN